MTDLSPSKKPVIWFVIINKVGEDEGSNGCTISISLCLALIEKNATNPTCIFPQSLQDWKVNVASVWLMPQWTIFPKNLN